MNYCLVLPLISVADVPKLALCCVIVVKTTSLMTNRKYVWSVKDPADRLGFVGIAVSPMIGRGLLDFAEIRYNGWSVYISSNG